MEQLPTYSASIIPCCALLAAKLLSSHPRDGAGRVDLLRGHCRSSLQRTSSLYQALLKNTTLQYLYLEGNDFNDEGALYLAEAIVINTSLQHLDVSFNLMVEQGKLFFRKSLQENPSLKDIIGFELVVDNMDINISIGNETILEKWRNEINSTRKYLQPILEN